MASDGLDNILYWADDFQRLAQNLEKASAAWIPIDRSQDSSPDKENGEFRTRSGIVWRNAIEAGIVMFELCGLGAFDHEPRIKNIICQMRSEFMGCLQEFKVPYGHMVLNVPYGFRVERSYDVYFVKIFEGFCKVRASCFEDQRIFESHYIDVKEKAKLHARLMRELGESLRSHYGKAKL